MVNMQSDNNRFVQDYIEVSDQDTIRLKGHRIGLEHIIERYQEGFSAEQIALDFPGLKLEAIYAIITFYLRNQPEIDSYLILINARAETAYQQWANQPQSQASVRIRSLQAQRQRKAS